MTGAAISAATVAVAYGLKHVLEMRRGEDADDGATREARDEDGREEDNSRTAPASTSLLAAALRELAARKLRLTVEDAARNLGRRAGEHARELDDSVLVRRFVEAFSEATAQRRGSRPARS